MLCSKKAKASYRPAPPGRRPRSRTEDGNITRPPGEEHLILPRPVELGAASYFWLNVSKRSS